MAALTAAFELSQRSDWQQHFDITVYQLGWRLGGKGASGRNVKHHDRIEEHGLHVWLGFYHEAFRIVRACYAENRRPSDQPLARWQQAFIGCDRLAGVEYIGGERLPWHVDFPQAPGLPGDPETDRKPSMWTVLRKVYAFMKSMDSEGYGILASGSHGPDAKSKLKAWRQGFGKLKMKIQLGGVAVLEMLPFLLRRLGKKTSAAGMSGRAVHWLLDRCRREAWEKVCDCIETDTQARRSWIMLDLFIATVKGLQREGIHDFDGMSALDRYDFREFLTANGASEITLQSPVICGFYNLGFAYLEGKKNQPSLAAGVILRFSLQMFFNYRGAMFWKMTAGMGDVVFAPLYEVLSRRGVKFRFFHRVTSLSLSEDGSQIGAITLNKQVALKREYGHGGGYRPLISINGLPCWPSEPLFDQIHDGEAMEKAGIDLESDWHAWPAAESLQLNQGRDFDRVILGIGLAALPSITVDLMAANQRFADMITHIPTVATCAAQLWLGPDLKTLGWDPRSSLFDGEGEAMNTWSDMTHLLGVESWEDVQVGHLAYFCGVMEDSETPTGSDDVTFPSRMAEHARARAKALMESLGYLWPGGARNRGDGALDPKFLVGGEDPVTDQFFKANCHLSDRYVLAAKDTIRFRLKAHASGFSNLFLAGDWTDNSLNYGCIEAATRSGVQAAQAILKRKSLDED